MSAFVERFRRLRESSSYGWEVEDHGHGSDETMMQIYAHLGDVRTGTVTPGGAAGTKKPHRNRSSGGGSASRERATGLEPATSSLGSERARR
jgi:hypothetical protein